MMRTYSRKRPDNQMIDDVHELCRLCLNRALEVIPIFNEDNDDVCATLALRIRICVGLEVTREPCLPNIICKECYNELNKFYAFRKKCEVTYLKLKSHILAVRAKEYKQKLNENKENENKLCDTENEEFKFVVTFDKEQFVDVNVLNLNGVAQVNSFAEVPPEDGTSEPDLATFLSTKLLELGILTKQEDSLVYSNQNVRILQLESGDGSQVTMELVEESECEEPELQEELHMKETEHQINEDATSTLEERETTQENNVWIKYITPSKKYRKMNVKNGAWCSQCDKQFSSGSALARHMRVHSGERPYACSRCGRTFAQREVMRRHQLVHEEQRPHQCPCCSKSFTQRVSLLAHMRAHAPPNSRPLELHRCARCPKVFLYASGLSRHMMMHNGRVYVCGVCSRQFKDKSSLLRHLKNANHAPRDNAPT